MRRPLVRRDRRDVDLGERPRTLRTTTIPLGPRRTLNVSTVGTTARVERVTFQAITEADNGGSQASGFLILPAEVVAAVRAALAEAIP